MRWVRVGCVWVGCVASALVVAPFAEAAFLPAADYPVGAPASAIGYGDYNGDGITDLVVARPSRNDVVFFAGRGDGTFAPGVSIPVGVDPVAVTSCDQVANTDWSHTGRCGLAVSDAGSHDIAVLTGNGDGTFRPAVFYPVDGAPGAISAGRLGDGFPPVIAFVEPDSDRVGALVSNGDGTFKPEVSIAVGHHPVAIEANTLAGPHDVIVVEEGANDVRRVYLTQSANPVPATPPIFLADGGSVAVGKSPRAIASFGDGTVAVANHDSADVTIVGGCGPSTTIPAGAAPIGITYLRLSGPNDPTIGAGDLAVINEGQHTLTLLTQRTYPSCVGAGSHSTYTTSTLPIPLDPSALIAGPLDRIGLSDLALLDPAGQVAVMNDAPGTLAVYPRTVNFGNVPLGQTATAYAKVLNVGTTAVHMRAAALWFPFPDGFSLQADGCAWKTLAAGQSCSIAIGFTPLTIGTAASNRLLLDDDAADSQYMIPLTGTGTTKISAHISAPAQSLTHALRAGLRTVINCSRACHVTIQARYRAHNRGNTLTRLGTGHASISRRGSTKIQILLRDTQQRLARARTLRIQLDATITASNTRPMHLTSTITLKRGT